MSVFDHFGGVGSETINYFRQKALSKMSGNVLVTLLVSGYDYLIFVIFFFFFQYLRLQGPYSGMTGPPS